MHFLFLCILSSTAIFTVFKSIDRFQVPTFPVIVINYLAATLMGFLINTDRVNFQGIVRADWLPVSIIIGILFIVMFFLVATSTQKAGISITTVASKMSVIFPITFSLILEPSDHLTLIKGLAIFATLSGVALTVYKPRKVTLDLTVVTIPLILFVGMGIVDSLVKFAQFRFVGDTETALFSAVLFLNAFLSGILVLLFTRKFRRSFFDPRIWAWGVLLGGVNFGSVFFLVRALNFESRLQSGLDSSVIFGINNIGIVGLSVIIGLWVFREHLRPLNWLGVIISAIALLLFILR